MRSPIGVSSAFFRNQTVAGIDQTADRRIEVELRLAVDLVVERVDLGIERRQPIAVARDGEGAHHVCRTVPPVRS